MTYIQKTKELIEQAFTNAGHPDLASQVKIIWSNKMYRAKGIAYQKKNNSHYRIKLSHKHAQDDKDFTLFTKTILHECGHIVAWFRHGYMIKPHGDEWKKASKDCGLENPERCWSDLKEQEIYKKYARKNLKKREICICNCLKEWKLIPGRAKTCRYFCPACKAVLRSTGKIISFK